MTQLLQSVFDQMARMPDAEQDAVARWLMDELAAERKWDDTLKRSSGALARMAGDALAEHQAEDTLRGFNQSYVNMLRCSGGQ